MKIYHLSLVTLVFSSLFLSCKKDKSGSSPSNDANVYVSGATPTGNNGVYWKNKVLNNCMTSLPSSMIVNGTDVYFPFANGYQKNGNQIVLPHALIIQHLAVKGNDVYAIGIGDSSDNSVFYWKNDQLIRTVMASQKPSLEYIGVSGNNVIIAGELGDSVGYWKNNESFTAVDKKGYVLRGLVVAGDDIYLYGATADDKGDAYWKNGVRHQIYSSHTITHTVAMNDLFVAGSDVYIVDGLNSSADRPLYYKNDLPVSTGILDSITITQSIAVHGNDVYIAGYKYFPSNTSSASVALLWKNGIMDTLGTNIITYKVIPTD